MKLRISYVFPVIFCAFLFISAGRLVMAGVSRAPNRSGNQPAVAARTPQAVSPVAEIPGPSPSPIQPSGGTTGGVTRLAGRIAHLASRAKTKIASLAAESAPFRDSLAHLDARWTYRISGLVRSSQVALADNGWLFYLTRQDGDTIEDYRGEARYPSYEAELLQERISALRNYLAGRGIAFAFVVVPNKENVYPEFVPPRFRRVSSVSRADDLLSRLRETPDLPIADPKPALLRHKSGGLVYYEYDSHWNRAGAYIGVQTVLAVLGRPSVPIERRNVVPGGKPYVQGDLTSLLGIPSIASRISSEYTVEGVPLIRPDRTVWRQLGSAENPGSRTPDSLLILGDSFKTEFAPPFLEEFRRVSDVHWDECSDFPSLLDRIQPDAVVLEFVERYLPYAAKTIARLLPP